MNTHTTGRRERRRQRTRDQLRQAALQLILERGYEAVSIQDITDRADLGRGTFYLHFKDKEDLVWSMIREGFEQVDRYARERFSRGIPRQAEYYGYLNIFQHAQQNRDLFRVMLGGLGSAALTAQASDFLASELVRDAAFAGVYADSPLPKEVLGQIVAGAVIRLVLWWLETPNQYTPEQMAGMLYQAIHHRVPPAPTHRSRA